MIIISFINKSSFAQNRNLQGNNNSTITLPLVVHVVYHDPSENLADTQVMKMVQVINEDFGRYNHDTANTPAAFLSVAASTGIQFCMATHDSAGNSSNGIDHFYTDTIQFGNPFLMSNPSFGGVNAWNTDKYFNIWIGNAAGWNGEGSYGYSMDTANHSYWGLVADYNYVNQIKLGDTSIVCGRSITHTLGHCFNLDHPFSNGLCFDADSVGDTPLEDGAAFGCPVFPMIDGCTINYPGVMFMNFMDYADEPCRNMFTQGQAARMVNSLNFYFPLLINSGGCLPLGISERGFNDQVILSPNPTCEYLFIKPIKPDLRSIVVFNLLGDIQNVNYLFSKSDETIEINTKLLAPGIYFLKIIYDDHEVIRRFIKQF